MATEPHATKLNRAAYQDLVKEDLDWLKKQPRSLEREHIRQIVSSSTFYHYDAQQLLNELDWTPVDRCLPPLHDDGLGEDSSMESDRVLVWVKDNRHAFARYRIGKRTKTGFWSIEGFLGNFEVTHWKVLKKPEGV